MKKQTPGKIYLADQRGNQVTPQAQRFSTFNFGNYYHEHKKPFGNLAVVNEEILAAAQSQTYHSDRAAQVIIIPITGAVSLTIESDNPVLVEVGELQVITAPAECTFQITNPYPADNIQFLHLRIQTEEPVKTISSRSFPFNLNEIDNPLTEVIAATHVKDNLAYPFTLRLGRFTGRQEVVVPLNFKNQLFFAYVIAGAFEAEGRLLHEKDGLALWDTSEVELEALSNHALILVILLEK